MPDTKHDNPLNADPNLYVLQDSRSNADHQTVFWAKGGSGYTTDLNKAHLFTEGEAIHQHASRDTDIPHRVGDLVEGMRLTVDDTMLNHADYTQRTTLLTNLATFAEYTDDPVEKDIARHCYDEIQSAGPAIKAFEARQIVADSNLVPGATESIDKALVSRVTQLEANQPVVPSLVDADMADDPEGPSLG